MAGITYIWINSDSVHHAVILDVWSRRVVGYAIAPRIDARLTLAALRAALASHKPLARCICHSDRGCQCAAEDGRVKLAKHGLELDAPACQPL